MGCDGRRFPVLDKGYIYFAAARLSLFRSIEELRVGLAMHNRPPPIFNNARDDAGIGADPQLIGAAMANRKALLICEDTGGKRFWDKILPASELVDAVDVEDGGGREGVAKKYRERLQAGDD